MRKIALISLLALLAACADDAPLAPDQQHVGNIMAAKGGKKPPEEPSAADPAVAFFTYSRKYGYCLRVMNDDGSNDTRLICGSGVQWPSWSPGGASIAFKQKYPYELWRMYVDVDEYGVPYGDFREYDQPLAACAGEPAWSPAPVQALGNKEIIAYPEEGCPDAQQNVLRYVCADGSGCEGTLRPATPGRVWVGYPAWSPDAAAVGFIERYYSEEGPRLRIVILDIDSDRTSIVFDRGDLYEVWDLDWSRNGNRLAFSAMSVSGSGKGGKGKPKYTRYVYTLSVTAADGTWEADNLTQVIEGTGAAWSPDDQHLVVRSGGDLVKIDSQTGTIIQTLRQGGYGPDWKRP